jgi:Aspartyl protease
MVQVEIAAVDAATGVLLGSPLTTTLKVDSGADISVLDDGLAPSLGIDLSMCDTMPVQGVSGNLSDVPMASVKMELVGRWLDVPVVFIPNELLLGREVAFDALYLGFAHKAGFLLAATCS